MGTLLKGATLVELDPPAVERADLRVREGRIIERGPGLSASAPAGEEVVELSGKVVMPGLVCAHHHLYSALARGMPAVAPAPTSFLQILERVWWRLDQALDLDAVQMSAQVGGLDALSCGTTTVVDHHASPSAIEGSLRRVAAGLSACGLRGVLCYEVSDRHGPKGRDRGVEENVAFARHAKGRLRGMVGAHASFTLSRAALTALCEAVAATGAGLHIHLAEDPIDERLSFERYGQVPSQRLLELGLVTPQSLFVHGVHLGWPELSQMLSAGTWLAHNPRSNMNNQVGYAPVAKFGARAVLGTDGIGADMFSEAQLAYFRARDAGPSIDPLKLLAAGHRFASQVFGFPIGPLREGAAADLVVLDYQPPTPLSAENLAGHFLFGLSSRAVESVMVDGVWRTWARRVLGVDPHEVATAARHQAQAVWERMQEFA